MCTKTDYSGKDNDDNNDNNDNKKKMITYDDNSNFSNPHHRPDIKYG